MSETAAPGRARTSDRPRNTATQSRVTASASRGTNPVLLRFGRPKPTREIRPSEIHELRMQTLRIQNDIRLEQTKLNRLKARILNKTEAINRTLKQKSNDQSATGHQTTIAQLQRSISGAENTLDQLQKEVEEASLDDRTSIYQELEEELRATYLEYERLQGSLSESKEESRRLEKELMRVDDIASTGHLNDLRESIEQTKMINKGLRSKWYAYQKKMHNMNIERRITENRQKGVILKDTLREASEEYSWDVDRLNKLADVLDAQNEDYQNKVEDLINIIDGQRRRIVEHLMNRGSSTVSGAEGGGGTEAESEVKPQELTTE
jgi:chromosome segregation ATPase